MNEPTPRPDAAAMPPSELENGQDLRCAQCECRLEPEFAVRTENAAFCKPCYEALKATVEEQVATQSQGINWLGAVIMGLMGAALGAGVWWLFTVLTSWSVGIIAVGIGFAAGVGVVAGSGGKRSRALQALSVVLSMAGFFVGQYWVVRTFVLREAENQGGFIELPVMPNVELLTTVITNMGVMELVFLGIVVWQAWSIPNPTRLKKD